MVHETLSQKNPTHKKRTSGVAQGVGPEFKPQYLKNNNDKKKKLVKVVGRALTPNASYLSISGKPR
jgi:hypothetical protein